MKRIIVVLLIVLMILPIVSSYAEGFEGEGFPTPEEAVLAYLQGFRKCDLQEMLSTFATETLAEHMDTSRYMIQFNTLMLNNGFCLPVTNDYAHQVATARLQESIVQRMYMQYIILTTQETEFEKEIVRNDEVSFMPEEDDRIDRFIEIMSSNSFTDIMKECEFVEWMDASAYLGESEQETFFKGQGKWAECFGADDIRDLLAHIQLGGEDYVLIMECCRFGDAWYNMSNSLLVLYLGANPWLAGLMPMEEFS